jgi:predicted small lipoprotein YifL
MSLSSSLSGCCESGPVYFLKKDELRVNVCVLRWAVIRDPCLLVTVKGCGMYGDMCLGTYL